VKINTHKIQPFISDDKVYHADTCLPLVDAVSRNKVKFKALARYTYPGSRLTNETIGLNSIGYWDAEEPQDWGLDWHRNEGVEIHFLESGSMPYAQNKHVMDLLPNHLTFTRPWEIHKVGNPSIGIGKFYWVIIDVGVRRPHQKWTWPEWVVLTEKDLNRLTSILRYNENWIWKANKKIFNCFRRIGKHVDTDINGSNSSKIRIIVNELLVLILELIDTNELNLNENLTNTERSVSHFLSELDKALYENWTIVKMAESAGIGVTRFIYHFKQLTNLTPMRYLVMRRLELSKKILLNQPCLGIAKIAYSCGFSTSQYFSTLFKKYEKCTPNEFRNNHVLNKIS